MWEMIVLRLILLGPPGAGKGTQAAKIVSKYNIPHISTGDIFRKNIKEGTALGLKAKEYMDKGLLVPDDLVVSIVKSRLEEDDCNSGFLLDGFPRTVAQAEALDVELDTMKASLDKAIDVHVDKEILIDRAVGRRICRDCGATYHIKFNLSSKGDLCGNCGGELYQRDDDTEQTVTKRIEVYINQTQPLIEYYGKKGILNTVDGTKEISEVFESIEKILESVDR